MKIISAGGQLSNAQVDVTQDFNLKLTKDELRKIKNYEGLTDEQAEQLIAGLALYSIIAFNALKRV